MHFTSSYSRIRAEVTLHIITIHAFLGLSILVVLVLTVIGKECYDSRHRRPHPDNVTIRYGSGSDSEKGNHVEQSEK